MESHSAGKGWNGRESPCNSGFCVLYCRSKSENNGRCAGERKQHPAAEWGENPRETVTVMPIYSAKPDTQGAAPGPLPVPGAKAVIRTLHPAAFWRLGDFLLPGTMVPHAFHGKHDNPFKPRGRGRTADLSRPAFQKIFALFVVPFFFPRPGPCCRGRGPGDGKQGA